MSNIKSKLLGLLALGAMLDEDKEKDLFTLTKHPDLPKYDVIGDSLSTGKPKRHKLKKKRENKARAVQAKINKTWK